MANDTLYKNVDLMIPANDCDLKLNVIWEQQQMFFENILIGGNPATAYKIEKDQIQKVIFVQFLTFCLYEKNKNFGMYLNYYF